MQKTKINIDFGADEKVLEQMAKKYNFKGTLGADPTQANLEGEASKLLTYLISEDYWMEPKDAIAIFPQLIK